MHFGLATLNIFNREKMLKKMNSSILDKVNPNKVKGNFLDVGCGCGATLRQGCKINKESLYTGITLSSWQINKCNEFIKRDNINNANLVCGDYHFLPFKEEVFSGAYALESLCHSSNKEQVIKEVSRVLKKGSRFIIADGFIKGKTEKAGFIFKKMYKILCEGWALPGLANINDFERNLSENGFKIIEIDDISWKIAPSVIHAPFITLKYLMFAFIGKAPLKKQNINNLKGSFVSLFLGLHRKRFSYYRIVTEKI